MPTTPPGKHSQHTLFISAVPSAVLLKSSLFWVTYLAALLGALMLAQFLPKRWFWYAWGLFGSLGAVGVTRWFLRRERTGFAAVGWGLRPTTLWHFLAGVGLGGVLIAAIALLLAWWGQLRLVAIAHGSFGAVLWWNLALLPNALHEEVGFRGYTLMRLSPALGRWRTQLLTALVFALYHILGGQDVLNSLVGTASWSLIFGWTAVVSRGLAMPIGVHFASNVGQALLGMKIGQGFPGLWTLQPNTPPAAAWQQQTQLIALAAQVGVLTLCLIALVAINRWQTKPVSAA